MRGFVGVTDYDWYSFLSHLPDIDEVNFWQPSGNRLFKSLQPGEPFFFKLHAPHNAIAGVGFFAHSTILPISLAWSSFEIKNGARSYQEMRQRLEKYRRSGPSLEDYQIGCILLEQPVFFDRSQWIPIPPDFSLNIVQGKGYDLTRSHGERLWKQVQERLASISGYIQEQTNLAEPGRRYGEPVLVLPRLGQGSFRVIVTDAYQRRCAVTQEKILPALEAAHIKPFSESGPHKVQNGLLLRSDIHRLFDSGYVTVTTDHRFEASRKIREEFDNGEYYYKLSGARIHLPPTPEYQPDQEFLRWHNETKFRA
jgi:putative restriction endonuclease